MLERGRVGQEWRQARWDSFVLNTPNWAQQLPGFAYDGPDPDAFAPLAEVIAYLEDYAASFAAPVREGVSVTALRAAPAGGYRLDTVTGPVDARAVIVATGAYQRADAVAPARRRAAGGLPAAHGGVPQPGRAPRRRRPRRRQRPVGLPGGRGPARRGREPSTCPSARARGCRAAPRPRPGPLDGRDRHAGPDGRHADGTERAPRLQPRRERNEDGHDCNPLTLMGRGAVPVGRLEGFRGARALFADDLAVNIAKGLEFEAGLRRHFDEHAGLAPEPSAAEVPELPDVRELDLAEVGAIVWATGFRPDYRWIELPVLDASGRPLHRRGLTDFPGTRLRRHALAAQAEVVALRRRGRGRRARRRAARRLGAGPVSGRFWTKRR